MVAPASHVSALAFAFFRFLFSNSFHFNDAVPSTVYVEAYEGGLTWCSRTSTEGLPALKPHH